MARQKRDWHPKFLDYMEKIVNHPNYDSMPNKLRDGGDIHWVSPSDKKRGRWWDNMKDEMMLPDRAAVARAIHPPVMGGMKPCQICGEELSIHYLYPNKNTLKKIFRITGLEFESYDLEVWEIIDVILKESGSGGIEVVKKIFDIPPEIPPRRDDYINFINEERRTRLSPGAMSNPPDRLDGFHTYNACCRSREDTGRHRSNLARYTQDRRAYENWAEGNWNLANRLMGEFISFSERVDCPNCGTRERMTADHIGPISLGFQHRPKFNPLCGGCNSGKNNRMTFQDVQTLIEDERGAEVISWHSKYLWDQLKGRVKNDEDARRLSSLMRENLHNVLTLLSIIHEEGCGEFLIRYLNPQYSYYDYKFKGFHPLRLDRMKTIRQPLDSKNKRKNAGRYMRISLESLNDYATKENRNVKEMRSSKVQSGVGEVLKHLRNGDHDHADQRLREVIKMISEEIASRF